MYYKIDIKSIIVKYRIIGEMFPCFASTGWKTNSCRYSHHMIKVYVAGTLIIHQLPIHLLPPRFCSKPLSTKVVVLFIVYWYISQLNYFCILRL